MNWDTKLIKRLFSLPVLLFAAWLVSYMVSIQGQACPHSSATIVLCMTVSLLILLLGLHIQYMMVRAGMLPTIFPKPQHREFDSIVNDILVHDEFLKLQTYFHHTSHIYDHVVRVSYIAYAISKVLGLDYIAAARGGLLHDFFLYDWRERKAADPKRSLHGKDHPKIALANARLYFEVSELEADIILTHMFPKTKPAPHYLESAVVSLSDKLSTLYEYSNSLIKRIVREQ